MTSAAGGRNPDAVARDLGAVAPGRLSSVMNASRRRAPQSQFTAGVGVLADRNLKIGRPEAGGRLRDLVLRLQHSSRTHQLAARIEPP